MKLTNYELSKANESSLKVLEAVIALKQLESLIGRKNVPSEFEVEQLKKIKEELANIWTDLELFNVDTQYDHVFKWGKRGIR